VKMIRSRTVTLLLLCLLGVYAGLAWAQGSPYPLHFNYPLIQTGIQITCPTCGGGGGGGGGASSLVYTTAGSPARGRIVTSFNNLSGFGFSIAASGSPATTDNQITYTVSTTSGNANFEVVTNNKEMLLTSNQLSVPVPIIFPAAAATPTPGVDFMTQVSSNIYVGLITGHSFNVQVGTGGDGLAVQNGAAGPQVYSNQFASLTQPSQFYGFGGGAGNGNTIQADDANSASAVSLSITNHIAQTNFGAHIMNLYTGIGTATLADFFDYKGAASFAEANATVSSAGVFTGPSLILSTAAATPTPGVTYLSNNAGSAVINVPSGDQAAFSINGVVTLSENAGSTSWGMPAGGAFASQKFRGNNDNAEFLTFQQAAGNGLELQSNENSASNAVQLTLQNNGSITTFGAHALNIKSFTGGTTLVADIDYKGAASFAQGNATISSNGVFTGTQLVFPPAANTGTGAVSINWAASAMQTLAVNSNSTITFTGAISGETIVITATNANNYTLTWPTIDWGGSVVPKLTTSGGTDVYSILDFAGTFYGSVVQAVGSGGGTAFQFNPIFLAPAAVATPTPGVAYIVNSNGTLAQENMPTGGHFQWTVNGSDVLDYGETTSGKWTTGQPFVFNAAVTDSSLTVTSTAKVNGSSVCTQATGCPSTSATGTRVLTLTAPAITGSTVLEGSCFGMTTAMESLALGQGDLVFTAAGTGVNACTVQLYDATAASTICSYTATTCSTVPAGAQEVLSSPCTLPAAIHLICLESVGNTGTTLPLSTATWTY
jgi:hypothetical protein